MMRRALAGLTGAAAFALAALVLFSLLAPWLPAADSVAHFRHILAGMLAVVALGALALRLRRAGAAALATAALAFAAMPQLLPPAETDAPAGLVLVQANLNYANRETPGLGDLADGADFLAFQEVSEFNGHALEALRADFPAQMRCPLTRRMHVAILSRRPALAAGCAEGLAWMRVDLGGREVTVASLHLHWPWPFGQRAQIERLRPALEALARPVILAGDFNAAPWSAAVGDIARWTGTEVVPGLRTTIRPRLPYLGLRLGLPVDHVLLPPEVRALRIELAEPVGSDHRQVRTWIGAGD